MSSPAQRLAAVKADASSKPDWSSFRPCFIAHLIDWSPSVSYHKRRHSHITAHLWKIITNVPLKKKKKQKQKQKNNLIEKPLQTASPRSRRSTKEASKAPLHKYHSPMRKTKRRQLKNIAAGERDARSVELMKSPNSRVVEETNVDEDSWVIVRKQKIRVFIPPLSVAVTTDHEKSRNKRIQPGVRKRGRPKLQRKDDVSLLEKQKTQCGEHQKTSGSNISAGLLSPANKEQSIVTPAIVAEAPNIVTGSSDGLPSQKDVEQGSNELSSQKNVDLTSHICHLPEDQLLEDKDKNGDSGNPVNDSQNVVGEPSSTLQPLSEAESARIPQVQHDFRPLESVQYPNSCRVQDRNIRALVLEHKLELAGGVNKWLISKGLERFVDIFQKEKMGNFELLNLTMERLKGMGLNAVGPRRKLMHAIDCLTQP